MPEAAAPVMLVVKPLVPLGLIVWFWRGGAYPELRGVRLQAGGLLLVLPLSALRGRRRALLVARQLFVQLGRLAGLAGHGVEREGR